MICIRYPAAKATLGALLAAGFIAGCQTTDPYTGENKTSSATYGALIGAGTGAAIGMISGKDAKQRKQRALVGAGVGALAGGAVGGYMDRQESELRAMMRDSGVTVTRRGDDIILNMPGNVTFRSGSADLNTQFFKVLDGVAAVAKKYDKTIIEIAGHTDNVGSAGYNMQLSLRRAESGRRRQPHHDRRRRRRPSDREQRDRTGPLREPSRRSDACTAHSGLAKRGARAGSAAAEPGSQPNRRRT
jgi:outer membrane protein OmpA-like peptidoglycan-associated protein